ncbi:deoxyribonuclease IV [Methanotorris igneus]|uniref:Xylose isomerase domain-containing protein TIM barrel n=1 Tax=Methanotorris igneus (strain DSM 5666 / JCM 11834 / Kol 5) TaxID=880724 RepID=F6BDJ6_METIK|nr:deoxyribonuclease IV [Methanotorris igneus]AEF96557.1 Xylose isomerase domain-containing protein TIM barrel [Methanotorris igneus Kol 5]
MGLKFGTAGIPINAKSNYDAITFLRKVGLNALELEFVRGVNMKEDYAKKLKSHAKEDVVLSAHAPYYINLNAKEEDKIEGSIRRIVNTAKITNVCGDNVVFHPGYYLKKNKEEVYKKIVSNIKRILDIMEENKIKSMLRPETTGKISQFGSIDEIIDLCYELNILPCVDFAHIYARSLGKINDYNSFHNILSKIEDKLGKDAIKNMHIHMSGIDFGKGGERSHLPLKESKFNYKDVLKVLKDFDVKGVVICESPKLEYDALLMKKYYESL